MAFRMSDYKRLTTNKQGRLARPVPKLAGSLLRINRRGIFAPAGSPIQSYLRLSRSRAPEPAALVRSAAVTLVSAAAVIAYEPTRARHPAMTATSTSSNSLAFRQILDTFNTSPPPSSQHHHLPDHLYLEPLQPIHEQPPSLIPRPRPMDRSDRMDRTDRPPLHQRASSSAGLGGAAGASAHAAGSGTHAHSRTPTGSTSRPKVSTAHARQSLTDA